MTTNRRIVIIGAGLAGLRTAENLRRLGHTGPIALIGAEKYPPYDRPPLSKSYLESENAPTPFLRPREAIDALDIDLRLMSRAVGLDPDARLVHLCDAADEPYDVLVIATGAVPRVLPGTAPRAGLHVLRTVDDARELAADIRRSGELLILGAGFIGCEVAATAQGIGTRVTLIEALPAPLIRVAGEDVSNEVVAMHRAHGVELRAGTRVERLTGEDRVTGVMLSTGEELPGTSILVALGVKPDVDWLSGSNLEIGDGIMCDAVGRTSAPEVFALGDVAFWEPLRPGLAGRHEHWTTAADQAVVVAQNILGGANGKVAPFEEVPYFWSDLYGVKLQALGWPSGDLATRPFRAGASSDRLVVLYVDDQQKLTGILGFGTPRIVMSARRLLVDGISADDAASALGLTETVLT
ncbi:MAG TPA: FAD-dependent oxidoreductase [Acidimicrobiales bacterium]|nr:FAD-dependent oxidoreductase [Acidimicrobiales bacterium]